MRTASTALLLAAALVLGGCASTAVPVSRSVGAQAGTSKTGTGELNASLDPLLERYAGLAGAESALWSSGTLGGGAPGPSSYWIDAVVTLPTTDYDALRAAHDYSEATEAPSVADTLAEHVPAGRLLRSDTLDADFAPAEGTSRVYLSDSARSLVLVSVFE